MNKKGRIAGCDIEDFDGTDLTQQTWRGSIVKNVPSDEWEHTWTTVLFHALASAKSPMHQLESRDLQALSVV